MITYTGFDKPHKLSSSNIPFEEVPRYKSTYKFQYDDYLGDFVSNEMFPAKERMKQFTIKILISIVALVLIKLSSVIQ